MAEIFENYEGTFFILSELGQPFFKTLHKFELKNLTVKVPVPMVIALRKLFLKNYFQILAFDK